MISLVAVTGVVACSGSDADSSFPTAPPVPTRAATATAAPRPDPSPTIAPSPTAFPVTPIVSVTPTAIPTLTVEEYFEASDSLVQMLSWIDANCDGRIYQTVRSTRLPSDLSALENGAGWYLSLSQVKRLSPEQVPWPGDIGAEPGIWFDPNTGITSMHENLSDDCFDAALFGLEPFKIFDLGPETTIVETIRFNDDRVSMITWLEEDRVLIEVFHLAEPFELTSSTGQRYFELSRVGGVWQSKDVTSIFSNVLGDCSTTASDSSPVSGIWIVRLCQSVPGTTVFQFDFDSFELIDKFKLENGLFVISIAASQIGSEVWVSAWGGRQSTVIDLNTEDPDDPIVFDGLVVSVGLAPDGKSIAVIHPIQGFSSDRQQQDFDGRWSLTTVDLATREEVTLVANFTGLGWRLQWVDDGTRIFALANGSLSHSFVIDLDSELAARLSIPFGASDMSADSGTLIILSDVTGDLEIRSIPPIVAR